MIFLLFVILAQSQDLVIWLRVSSISQTQTTEYISENFCQMEAVNMSIEFDHIFNILIFEDQQLIDQIQTQEIDRWIKISIFKSGNIFIYEKRIQLKKAINQIEVRQIKRNYNDFFIEIQQDDKYNNFLLQNFTQSYLNELTFNALISDSDALISLWFKFMIDYDEINYIYLQNFKAQNFNTIIKLLQIEMNQIIILNSSNEQSIKFIDGMRWNLIQINIQQDQISVTIITNHWQIDQTIQIKNIQNIVNKEIMIKQQGLYIGHFSIQYKDIQFYCSPGCIDCQDKKCYKCQNDQYLVDNQCRCLKFYQSQNVDGYCKMFPDLYEKNLQDLDYDLFKSQKCQFAYIYHDGNCIPCPWFQGKLCSACITNDILYEKQIIRCWQNVFYKLEQNQFVPLIKLNLDNEFNIKEKQKKLFLKNNTQLIQNNDQNDYKGGLAYFNSVRCPYNCEQCSQWDGITYCITLFENQNYIQDTENGIPLLNNQMNVYIIDIFVSNNKSKLIYYHNQRYYDYLKQIIQIIEFNSIIVAGIHTIKLIFDLQIESYAHQFFQELYIEMLYVLQKLNLVKTNHNLYCAIPYIHLKIKSNNVKLIIEQFIEINFIHKLTISDIQFFSLFKIQLLRAPIIILKNIHFDSTKFSIEINCEMLIFQNVTFENIVSQNDYFFGINSKYLKLQNIIIRNCSFNESNLFYLSYNGYIDASLFIETFHIQQSIFFKTYIIFLNIYCVIQLENFILNHSKLNQSIIIVNKQQSPILITQMDTLYLANSFIYYSFLPSFQNQHMQNIAIINCTLEKIKIFLNNIQFKNMNDIRIRNIFLQQINVSQVENLFQIITDQQIINISNIIIQQVIEESKSTIIFRMMSEGVKLNYMYISNISFYQLFLIRCTIGEISDLLIRNSKIQNMFDYFADKLFIHRIRVSNIESFQEMFILNCAQLIVLEYITLANSNCYINQDINQKKIIYILGDQEGHIKIQKLLFVNNYFQINSTFEYINIDSELKRIEIFNISFVNNSIKTLIVNLIQTTSKQLLIFHIYTFNLTVVNFENTDLMSAVFKFDSRFFARLIFFRVSSVSLFGCNLFSSWATNLLINQFYISNIILTQSMLICINGYLDSTIIILDLKCSQIKTNTALIQILSQNSEGKMYLDDSLIQQIESNSNIITIESNMQNILLFNIYITQIISKQMIYLLYTNQGSIDILEIFSMILENSNIGLVELSNCKNIKIHGSDFTNLQFQESFISINKNSQFELQSTFFKKIQINKPLLNVNQNNLITSRIIIQVLKIQNLKILDNQEALLLFNHGNKFLMLYVYFLNNSCNCSVIRLQQFNNKARVYFIDTIFLSNNFTQILNFNQKEMKFTKQQIEQYFFEYQKMNIQEESNKKPQFYQNQIVKLNINNQYWLESQIKLQNRIEDKDIKMDKKLNDKLFYIPSGQILNQYQRLVLDKQILEQYIYKFLFFLVDSDSTINCTLNLIQINLLDQSYNIFQSFTIQINQDLSNFLQINMDPYNKLFNYTIQLICQNQNLIQSIQYRVKPFPCQMGEYYYNQQCNLCNIKYSFNSLENNQNKCDQFDQSIVIKMRQGLLKLKIGFWRPTYNNKYIILCKSNKNCLGSWTVGDYSCLKGYIGAQCQECDLYNKRGNGFYSKLQDQCISCSSSSYSLITYVIIIFCYQLIQTYLASYRSYQYISNQKILISQHKYYLILKNLQADQISINIKILLDAYIKLILINQLQFYLPDILNISFNLFPQELVNRGLYCSIHQLGPNILVLELICIFLFTLLLIQICNIVYLLLVFKKVINQSITHIATIFQYGYKQSYVYISQLLISQIIYVNISNEYYLAGNRQYEYKFYKNITYQIILPIYLVYSIILPIVIIILITIKRNKNIQKFSKIWAYFIQDYNSQCLFWEIYQLLQYSLLLFIFFYFWNQRDTQFVSFIIVILINLIIQQKKNVYYIKNLNSILFETQLKVIGLQTLFYQYYQVENLQTSILICVLIILLNYYILKSILYNIIRRIIVKYVHYTIKYQNKILQRFPKFIIIQRKLSLYQNPTRAKENFQKLIKILKRSHQSSSKWDQPISLYNAPNNSQFVELQNPEIELIEFQKSVK